MQWSWTQKQVDLMHIDPADFDVEISIFKDWLRDYGPYTWIEFGDTKISEFDPS